MIRLSIRRPVAVAMTYLAVGLLGMAAWRNIPIELLPDEDLPRLTVRGTWRGASPETVEAFLTSPVEAAVQLVRGVEKVTSTSEEAGTTIEVEFARETDMDFARLDLSERLATLEENELPPGVSEVMVEPYRPPEFSEQLGQGFLTYTFTGPRTLEALREHLEEQVRPELSRIEGVAVVLIYGGRDRLVEIELDREQMAALGVTAAQVQERIRSLDLVREAGAIRADRREWTVTIQNRAQSVQDVLQTIVNDDGNRIVRVSDVADVRDTFEEARGYYRVNGRPAVNMILRKEIGANTVRVADRVKERMAELEALSPPNTRFILDDDESEDIRRQLTDLRSRAVVAAFVIFVVLMGFLGSVRSAAVVFATIAFSILISLNLIYFMGLSLNLLTLMGLAMGFGLIVDNSIVVLENVYRRWEAGRDPEQAALEGTSEVVLPILAATATTLIVFVPFVYLQGELRVFYVPLAIVVALTLVASLFVAFTFIPALSRRVLGASAPAAGVAAGSERKLGTPFYERFYRGLVSLTLSWPWVAVVLAASGLGGSYYLFDRYVTRGVLWSGAWGQETYISIQINLPRGSDLARTDELTRYFEDRLLGISEAEQFVSQVQDEFAFIRVTFPEELENTQVPVAIKDRLFAYSLGFSGAEVRVYGYGPSFYGGGGGAPNYSIQVLGYNYEEVRDIAENIGTRLSRISRVRDVNTNATGRFFDRERSSEFAVSIDRDALARYDLTVQELVPQIAAAVAGQSSEEIMKIGGDDVRFEVKLEGNRQVDLTRLRETLIDSPLGQPIRLAELVRIDSRDVLARILREDQQYQRTVSYEFRGPQKLGDLVHDAVIDATEVGPGYSVKKADTWRWSVEERTQIYLVLGLSVLLVYMVTAALFESLVLPLCVLLTVPMALIGVFLIFFYTNANFTREAYIGVIMMGGIVVNNAILLVDHVGRVRREGGRPLTEAILVGTLERVRPILMTTATTVIGLLPLVLFSDSANANIWNALAYALIGGLLSSTLLVLTVTPALYLLFERRRPARAPQWTPELAPAGAD